MGIKDMISRAGSKAANQVANLSSLSEKQLEDIQAQREQYLSQMPDPSDAAAEELTMRLLAASSVEIYRAYLTQLKELYVPVEKRIEYGSDFDTARNIRFFNITKWVVNREENSLEKLVNVYEVLSNEDCNISLIFHRTQETTHVFLAVTNTQNADNNVDSENYRIRLSEAIRGNFPGSEWSKEPGTGTPPCLSNNIPYSVAIASNIPTEKSEKFISQTIEKLLDGIVPDKRSKEYILILMATPIRDIEYHKLSLGQMYSALAPYASWSTNFTYNESGTLGSSATVGINIGASAGIQNGQNQSVGSTHGTTDSSGNSVTDSTGTSETDSTGTSVTDSTGTSTSASKGSTTTNTTSHTSGTNSSHSDSSGISGAVFASGSTGIKPFGIGVDATAGISASSNISNSDTTGSSVSDAASKAFARSTTDTLTDSTSHAVADTIGHAVASSTGRAIANTLGRAVSNSVSRTAGIFRSVNFGANFGASFARSSNVTASVGKNEGITQSFTNYNIKHALELLENQMKRLELSTALGMWDFAAYVLSEDQNVANNVAHSYLALTQGEESYMSQSAINLWRGDMGEDSGDAREICGYLRELRHPVFGLNPNAIEQHPQYRVYPPCVTATTYLSGKELAYSLNFPRKSIPGLPVIECAEFGRNVVSYDAQDKAIEKLDLGHIFHMNHEEPTPVWLAKKSLTSHTFITGSTGSGKSNTVYQLLHEAVEQGTTFMVIEPAKGEYKHIFGLRADVSVYGTNPALTPLLRINPFRFPKGVHVLEHLDRLVEIFNVCWPMYAAMPAVLKNAVEKSYTDCGWDLARSTNRYDEDLYPSFADVARNIREIIDTSEYDTENKGAYKGSLLTRLQSLTNGINGMIFTNEDLNDASLFDGNVIVDLSRVGSSETKSLIMGMLVLKLQEYRMTSPSKMNANLKHITVLEEAHNLLKRTSTEQSSESSNLSGKSVEMLANAIAEMRTYGEGFIIADQAPGLLDLSVIRNTNTKIIMRLPSQSDRELVGRAANLSDEQIKELAKLPCGVAAVYQNEWVQPVLCKVERYAIPEELYSYSPNTDDPHFDLEANSASESLLDYIMNRALYQKDEQVELGRLKRTVLRSRLDTTVKRDLMDFLIADKRNALESLRHLIYDFLAADKAIKASVNCGEIKEWVRSVVSNLHPSIHAYTSKQIDLAMALILYEQSLRDAAYNNVFIRFTEIYRDKGGVF